MMNSFKIDLRALTFAQKAELAGWLVKYADGAHRIEKGGRYMVQGESHKVWIDQNGFFLYVSENFEVKQGYSVNRFNKNPLQVATLCDILQSL